MANTRREPVSYRPFRVEPLLADGLLPVARAGGELENAASDAFFQLAARFGERADQETEDKYGRAGELAGLEGAPDLSVTGGGKRPRNLLAAIEQVESGGNPDAESPVGALGLMQVMPLTGREIAAELGDTAFPKDAAGQRAYLKKPDVSRRYGGHYYAKMLKRYNGDEEAALIAYNGGPKRADDWLKANRDDNVIPAETRGYYRKVLAAADRAAGTDLPVITRHQDGRAAGPDMTGVAGTVLDRFKAVQNAFGASVPVVSGFRDAGRNAAAGGAKASQHLHGKALDLDVSDMSQEDRIRLIQTASAQGFTGIGVYKNSIHLDEGPRRAWGPSHHRESVPAWASAAIGDHEAGKNVALTPGGPTISATGGGARPMAGNSLAAKAYNKGFTRTYLAKLDTEMRSTVGQVYDLYKDDPATLERAFGELKGELAREHVFPEIRAQFSTGFDRMAESYLGQARDNARAAIKQQDRADFEARTQELATEQARKVAGFDPKSAAAGNAIANDQQAIEDHWDDAVRRGVVDADDAERAKIAGRRETALSYYGKQAEALDADGVAGMREEMRKDFAEGGLAGLDGEGWQSLDKQLQGLETKKRADAERATAEFRERGDTMAARLLQGFDIDPAELNKYMLDAGKTPAGKAALQETFAKISAGRAINDFSLAEGKKYVEGLRKQYGDKPTEAQLRQLGFAATMWEQKRKAIATDPVSYAEKQGIVPETPMLTEAATAGDMVKIMGSRVATAGEAARQLGTQTRYLKEGEAKALAASIKADPAKGASVAAAIVAGAGKQAGDVLSEFGADAPMIAESGAILAFDGSARAAEDVILGYGSVDGKKPKGLKTDAERESFGRVTGQALALAGKDRDRIARAAASIARKRITEEGLDPDSEEALAVHAQAVNEAAGAVYDRGVQYGGFVDVGDWYFESGQKVLAPNFLRADAFEDVLLMVNDADLATLKVKPKGGIGFHQFGRQAMTPARTLRDAVPVAVDGGYAFAKGDPNGADPQFVQGDDGKIFVLDLESLRDRLEPRMPGVWR